MVVKWRRLELSAWDVAATIASATTSSIVTIAERAREDEADSKALRNLPVDLGHSSGCLSVLAKMIAHVNCSGNSGLATKNDEEQASAGRISQARLHLARYQQCSTYELENSKS